MSNIKYELIIAICDIGLADEVMDLAKNAGARGGTIVHGRGTVDEEIVKFFSLTIQPEKEILLIVTKVELKKDIMLAISKKQGSDNKPLVVCFSVPVVDVLGFSF